MRRAARGAVLGLEVYPMPRRLAVDGLCYMAAAATAAVVGIGIIWATLSGVISQNSLAQRSLAGGGLGKTRAGSC